MTTTAAPTAAHASLHTNNSYNPYLSPLQVETAERNKDSYPPLPNVCVVTGGTGFTGTRLVEMLVERGAKRVVAFDIVPKERLKYCWDHPAIEYVVGDITDAKAVAEAVKGADCVWHLAAAVGPFHPLAVYDKINYQGTLNVIDACRKHGVRKLVYSSSPSTRFKGSRLPWGCPDLDGLTEAQMPSLPLARYMQPYAATKAKGELAVVRASQEEGDFLCVSVAPHQLYGPRDNLFLPNVLEAAGSGRLRIFGTGKNRICFTHIDNYCHGLIIAERQLYKGSPVLGKFYITTEALTRSPLRICTSGVKSTKPSSRVASLR